MEASPVATRHPVGCKHIIAGLQGDHDYDSLRVPLIKCEQLHVAASGVLLALWYLGHLQPDSHTLAIYSSGMA